MDVTRYANTPYAGPLAKVKSYMVEMGRKGLKPEQIGQTVLIALTTASPKTRYVVTPDPLQNCLSLNMPKRVIDRTIAKRLGLVRR